MTPAAPARRPVESMRVVVLGGTGFVGGHLVARLVQSGHRVDVLSRNLQMKRELKVLPRTQVLTIDVYDRAALAAVLAGADAVINLVGILNERGFGGKGFRKAHVELTATVIAACGQAAVGRLLQMSALRAGEGDSHYLRTRGEAETLVRESSLRWTIIRPSVIFGPDDGLFCRFAGLLRWLPVLPIARAKARFAPVYVGDVAEAMVRSLERPASIGQVHELYGRQVMTLAQIVRYTAHQLGLRRWVIPLPDALGRLQALVGDVLPGKPISSDNYKSLALESVGRIDGLAVLGIEPTPVEAIVPWVLAGNRRQAQLDRHRGRAP